MSFSDEIDLEGGLSHNTWRPPSAGGVQQFQPLYQSCALGVKQINAAIAHLNNLGSQLGTKQDSTGLRDKLGVLVDSTADVCKTTNAQLQQLYGLASRDPNKHLQVSNLQEEFERALKRFRDVSSAASKREKSSLPATSRQAKVAAEEPPWAQDEDRPVERESARLLQTEELSVMERQHAQIVERDKQVREIETAVIDVNQIFQDLARITAEQSSMVDNIESSIEMTAHHTAEAAVEMRKAAKAQRSNRGCLCWIFLCVIITVAVILAITALGLTIRFA
jgi:t-SNARE complex subunit (syntaxin)